MINITKEEELRILDFEIRERKRKMELRRIKNLSDEDLLKERNKLEKEINKKFFY